MKIAAHAILLYELCYLKCKEGNLINHYSVVYFPLIVLAKWELRARLQETIVSSAILHDNLATYASTKKKQAYPYSLSCLLANIHDSWVLLFQHYTMICSAANIAGYMYVALASHLLESNVISSWHPRQAVSIHTVGDFYFFITNLQAVYRFINAGWFQFYHSFTYINVYFCKINFA